MGNSEFSKTGYFQLINDIRYNTEYYKIFKSASVLTQRIFKILFALTSAGSVVVWSKMSKYADVCAFIIMISQLLSVVVAVLPYDKRISEATSIIPKYEKLYNEAQPIFLDVMLDKLSDEEVNKIIKKYRDKIVEIDEEYFKEDSVPRRKLFIWLATKRSDHHFVINQWG